MNAPGLNFKADRPLHAPREAQAGPLIGPQPLIRTGRLTLRRPRASDAPAIAAAEVVRFQKKPSKKMASTPGDTKPTYSCMNW